MSTPRTIGRKSARRSVLIADRIADKAITVGGILVIGAVLGILVFLVYEVIPLFRGGSVESRITYTLKDPPKDVATVLTDDFKTVVIAVGRDGRVAAFHAHTGAPVPAPSFQFGGKEVTAIGKTLDSRRLAFGFSDGTVRLGQILIHTEILPAGSLPGKLIRLDDRDRTDGAAIYSTIPGNQVRKLTVDLTASEEIPVSRAGAPISVLDYRVGGTIERPSRTFVAVDTNRSATLNRVSYKKNLLTGKVTPKIQTAVLPPLPPGRPIVSALLTERGDQVYLAERSGKVYRFDTSDLNAPVLAETASVLPEGVELSTFGFLLGEQSILVGGSDGSLNIYFRLRRQDYGSSDGFALVRTRTFDPFPSAIVGFQPGQRGRVFATADSSGHVRLQDGTSQETLLSLDLDSKGGPSEGLTLAPREDAIGVIQRNATATFWDISVPHPETSLGSLFGKVWYEGYPEPTYTWQSSAATDDFEPKLSLIPLIFGTLKATFYSLMFALPVALLAAIYTSEFVHSSIRSTVKPVMEMMASLPSVILGFVAALVLAPIVESWISAVILAFVVVPLSLVSAAYLWQLLPPRVALYLEGSAKLIFIFVVVVSAAALCYLLGPTFEQVFFGGNFRTWLNGDIGSAVPFLFLLCLPVVMLAAGIGSSRALGDKLHKLVQGRSALVIGLLHLARWAVVAVASVAMSYGIAIVLSRIGLDPRGGLVGTYVQRNTLVVGFAMGFAVIPIIYTLAEDALNAVPEHLRAASLACGATPWQTAMWVILPTAVSGVFSAIMIGMGRAVGETMIVVMAAGNTPLLDMNIFNGLRSLSANIAVELPEAVKDGSLYRVLFLTALVLFGMTFVINTAAEIVRLRFRKRAQQL
jgi:phosphate transport system permease protein